MRAPDLAPPRTRFDLPDALSAVGPPESRGVARDGVRLLVATPDGVGHARFHDLPGLLEPGDLLVVNTSATLPGAVEATRESGAAVLVHVSTGSPDGTRVVEVRHVGGKRSGPLPDGAAGERLRLAGGATLVLLTGYPDAGRRLGSRLWRARLDADGTLESYLARHGRPIRYDYVPRAWPLGDYQTVFATHPGSAEMPSAGRPFTAELVTGLVARGVVLAPLVLHTGVSSLEAHEPPYPEWYDVPESTASLAAHTRARGRRVVAVGTTVVRALESVAGTDGGVTPGQGWTDLVLGPDRPARVVNGLVTGLHAPGSSHLDLLEAVVGPDLVQRTYDAAVADRYLWHEFGDSSLLLPDPPRGGRTSRSTPMRRLVRSLLGSQR